jgi:hypothetical protein
VLKGPTVFTNRLYTMQHSAESIFALEYLIENESIFETASACCS